MHFQLLTALTLLSITTALPSQSTPQGPPQAGLGHPPSFTLPDAEAVPALPVPGGKPVYNPAQNKRGLAFNDVKYIQSFWGAGTKVNWMYNWDSRIPTGAPYVQFVPMLWGDGPAHTTNWFGNAQDSINRGANNILGFNEPDQCFNSGQSCIGPEQAANSYRKYIQPFGNQAWLGSPAITNSADGTRWITAFLNNYCRDCQVDFVNMHWYGGTNAQEFIGWVQMVKGLIGGRRIWITEILWSSTRGLHCSANRAILTK
ncbi:putative Uncharacterized serine-rich protein C13G6.10c [Glarea lozoyensis 74030]|uniref:Putative Uncharacterized serine-rich protein C13G6.10c n=1 Tax=Glarea lozoyensis (strain ATCC 74030 / MF5533) TaxID=1104152 RepID=H0ENM7_GLAL7|nr:putative Uncharacterized serine-rich protein C13G6.10c [Glarea lozoyensis 74030]